jgi:hypothetical protein
MQKFRGNPGKLRAAHIKAERVGRRGVAVPVRSFTTDPLTRRLIRPLLISLMATALATGLMVIATITTPEYAWYWLIPYTFLVAMAAAYSAAWLNNPASRAVDKTVYRVSEVVVIIALARIISWLLFANLIPSLAELRLYLEQPLSFFLAGGFLSTAIIGLAAWWFSASLSALFCALDISEEELRYYTLSALAQKGMADDQPIQIPREQLQDAYMRYFIGGGIILVFLAALSTFEVREFATVTNPLAIARLGLEPVMLLALLAYFLVGIWLLSQARLSRLNARWLMDGAEMDAGFERNWQRTSLTWLALIALIAAFLPIGNTLAISRLIDVVVNAVFYVANLLVSLVGFLFGSMLVAIQDTVGDETPTPSAPFTPPSFVPPAEAAPPNPIFGIILSSAFWALMVALVVFAVLYVARERGYNVGWDRIQATAGQTKAWLLLVWAGLRGRLRKARKAIPERLRALRPDVGSLLPESEGRRRPPRPNALSPREQIRYYYLAAVKRAGEQGVPRRPSETPSEYAADLRQYWPDTEADVEELTSAFIEARYSPAEIPPETATTIKARWNQLRDRLQRRDQPPDEPGSS